MIDVRLYAASMCFFLVSCSAPTSSEQQAEYANHYVGTVSLLRSLEPAGATAILFDATGELAEISAGYADIGRGKKFDGTTRVSIGELSEIVISALIMHDAERGTLDIDMPFGRYLTTDQLAAGTPAELRIRDSTIREILYHGTGVRANFSLMLRSYDPSVDLEPYLSKAPVVRAPQAARIPSSALIDMLGLFIASRAESDLGAHANKVVFKPLKMRSASFGGTKRDSDYAMHYKYGQPLPEFGEPPAPSNSFVANSHDLVRFMNIFIAGGIDKDQRILSAASITDMLSSQSAAIKENQGVAVGLPWLLDPPGLSFLGNGAWYAGKYLGHRSCVVIVPGRGLGALAVTNAWSWDAKETLYAVCSSLLTQYAAEVLGIEEPREPKESRSPIPDDLLAWIEGTYASDLGLVTLALVGQMLKATFEGITTEYRYISNVGFISSTDSEIRSIQPTGNRSIDVRFASGCTSRASPKLATRGYPASWLSLPGLYRRSNGDDELPYAFLIRLDGDFYVIAWGDGREYALIPNADGSIGITCSGAAILFGKRLYLSETGTIMLESRPYRVRFSASSSP